MQIARTIWQTVIEFRRPRYHVKMVSKVIIDLGATRARIDALPEGPEIRQAAEHIARALEGQVIEHATLDHPSLKRAKKHIQGHRVELVDCHGKALLTQFSSGRTMYSHNQLYGIWLVVERGVIPETNRALRVGLHTATHSALLYSATDISLWKTEEVHQHPFLQRIGPDVLGKNTNPDVVLEQLTKLKNRQLASLYLDQGFIAGLGNYLRSEILFFSGVHPAKKPSQLSDAQLKKLAKNTIRSASEVINERAYASSKAHAKSANAKGPTLRERSFRCLCKSRQSCRVCGTKICTAMNSRRIYWCPSCQPED